MTTTKSLATLNRKIRGKMREVDAALAALPRPVPFAFGELVEAGGEPYEVVMQRGATVYVKDEHGSVREFPAGRVARL